MGYGAVVVGGRTMSRNWRREENVDSMLVFDSESAIMDVEVLFAIGVCGRFVSITLLGNGIGV